MIKKIKIASIWIDPEKEIVSKKEKTLGKKYKLCKVSIKVADDCPVFAGRYLNGSFFEYIDLKDAKKNKSATERAEYFKEQNNEKEIILDVTESDILDKEGRPYLAFKTLTKAQKEVAEQLM